MKMDDQGSCNPNTAPPLRRQNGSEIQNGQRQLGLTTELPPQEVRVNWTHERLER